MKTSEQLAERLDHLATYGKSKIVFVIGGSLGLSDEVMRRADESFVVFKDDISASVDEVDIGGAGV